MLSRCHITLLLPLAECASVWQFAARIQIPRLHSCNNRYRAGKDFRVEGTSSTRQMISLYGGTATGPSMNRLIAQVIPVAVSSHSSYVELSTIDSGSLMVSAHHTKQTIASAQVTPTVGKYMVSAVAERRQNLSLINRVLTRETDQYISFLSRA